MKILLTGAAGFLGSNIATRLIGENHEVIGLDDFSTGRAENLRELAGNPNFSLVRHDVREPFECNVDFILNFACPASPIHYQADPVRTIETNFLGIINMLHLAKSTGAKLLQASTSEVYGDPTVSPQVESYWGNVNPIGIRSCYDEGKRAAETLCFDYLRQYQVDARVIRIFNTYGPNMAIGDGRVVSNFVVQALLDNPITVYGEGLQSRSFCYVDDLVDGIFRMMSLPNNPKTPINLGNPKEFTMLELATKIISMTGSKSTLIYKDLPSDDPRQRQPSIAKATEILNWMPHVDLQDGLARTIEYFKAELAKN